MLCVIFIKLLKFLLVLLKFCYVTLLGTKTVLVHKKKIWNVEILNV